jgi:hypothetical protein
MTHNQSTSHTIDIDLSNCGKYLWSFTKHWSNRPKLLIVLFRPSPAKYAENDKIVTHLQAIASFNGFGAITIVHGIPLCTQYLSDIFEVHRNLLSGHSRESKIIHTNSIAVTTKLLEADAILIGWGAMARKCEQTFSHLMTTITRNRPPSTPIYCLEKTISGHPTNPMAKGVSGINTESRLKLWEN